MGDRPANDVVAGQLGRDKIDALRVLRFPKSSASAGSSWGKEAQQPARLLQLSEREYRKKKRDDADVLNPGFVSR